MAQQAQPNNPQRSGGNNVPLIRPEQLDSLPLNVTPEQRQQYKAALVTLYQVYDSNPPGSPQHAEAEGKIRTASMRLMQQLSNRGNRPGGPGGPGQPAGGPGQAQQQQQQQRPPQGPGQQGQGQQQGQMAQAMQGQGSGQGQQPQGQQPQQGQQPGQPQVQLSQQASQDFRSFGTVYPPPQVLAQGEPQISNYRKGFLNKLMQTLQRRDMAKMKGQNLQRQQQAGQLPPGSAGPAAVQQQLQAIKAEMEKAHEDFRNLGKQNALYGQQTGQGGNQQGQGQQVNGGGAGQMQRTNSQQGASVNAGQQGPGQEQGDVKMNMGGDSQQARTSSSPTQQQQASFQNQGGAPASAQQQNMNAQQQPPSATHPQQQTPQTATQGQPPQGFPQNQQQRPSITQQMNQQMQQNNMNQVPQQQQNTPTQGMPPQQQQQQQQQPSQPPQPQRPQALSHQAAISQASSARQDAAAQQGQPQQQPQQMQNMPNSNLPFNAPPSATQQTPSSAYPQQTLPQQASSSTKFPIPKQLQLDPRTQGPVQGPPSRPTMGGSMAGMMGQPGIARPGTFVLEGEGDRVLSKSKLQELVRQVTRSTGDTSTSDPNTQLTPDVEESVLDVADDFVDNVITSACRLAKLRGSQALDVRDIQIVLERNYGIRIPGYGLDEVRTVRKFVPAEGWRSKMQAVQAGKVMGGAGGRDT